MKKGAVVIICDLNFMKTAELKIDIKIYTNVTRCMVSSIPYLGAIVSKQRH